MPEQDSFSCSTGSKGFPISTDNVERKDVSHETAAQEKDEFSEIDRLSSEKGLSAEVAINSTRPAAIDVKAVSHGPPTVISHNLDDYEVISDIGQGQFGLVQKIRLKSAPQNMFLVWKKIRYIDMRDREKRQLTQEVQLLQALSHPNVVRYIGKINSKKEAVLYLIMEFCEGGDLARYLEHTVKKKHYFAEEQILDWFRQLVDALYYCHTRSEGRVLHRDLKPQNILLTAQKTRLKLADFGLAKMMSPEEVMTQTHVGTPYYMSPEVLGREQYGEKSDIWALGCLMFEIMTGTSPFARASSYANLCVLVRKGQVAEDKVPKFYCPELLQTIRQMLTSENSVIWRIWIINSFFRSSVGILQPSKRPSAEELRKSLVYRHAALLRQRDIADKALLARDTAITDLRRTIEQKRRELTTLQNELKQMRRQVSRFHKELQFLQDYVQFQKDSDDAIRRSLRLVTGSETTLANK